MAESSPDPAQDERVRLLIASAGRLLKRRRRPEALDILKELAALRPLDFEVIRLRVEFQAAMGDLNRIPALLELPGLTAEQIDKLSDRALKAAAPVRPFPEIWTLAQSFATGLAPGVRALLSLVKAAATELDDEILRLAMARLKGSDQQLVLACMAARDGDLTGAVNYLIAVPESWPRRLQVVETVYDAAKVLHDWPLIHATAGELVQSKASPTLDMRRHYAQAAATLGRVEEAQAAFKVYLDASQSFRDDPLLFEARWINLAQEAFERGDYRLGRADVARAQSLNLPRSRELLGTAAFDGLIESFQTELDWSGSIIHRLMVGEPIEDMPGEIVRIVSPRLKLFNADEPKYLGGQMNWLATVGEVLHQARTGGASATLMLSYLTPLARAAGLTSPPCVLSYHTEGATPGVVHFKDADIPTYVSIDEAGYAGWSSLAAQPLEELPLADIALETAQAFFAGFKARVLRENLSKYVQPDQGGEALPDRYIFLALQVTTDRVQALSRIDMLELLNLVAERFRGSDTRVVVKRHPLCTDPKIAEALSRLSDEGLIVVRTESIHTLLAGCEALVTTNSGVGSESLIHLKPIYLFGEADYAAIAHRVSDAADFREATTPIALPVAAETMIRFLYFYRRSFLTDLEDPAARRAAVEARIVRPALRRALRGEVAEFQPATERTRLPVRPSNPP